MRWNWSTITLISLCILGCQTRKTVDINSVIQDDAEMMELFVGTYTRTEGHVDGKAEGIYVLGMDQKGRLEHRQTLRGVINPSYLAVHENGKYLFVVNEVVDPGPSSGGLLTSYQRDSATGQWEFGNSVPVIGEAPCHVSLDQSGNYALVASYVTGNVASFAILKDGTCGEAVSVREHEGSGPFVARQEAPHAHMIQSGPQPGSVLAVDLGLDRVIHYRMDQQSGALEKVTETRTAAGKGPRHLALHPNGKWCYVLSEFDPLIEAYSFIAIDQPMQSFQSIRATGKVYPFNTCAAAAIYVSPDGRYLYTSNRDVSGETENSISVFSIDAESGILEYVSGHDTKGEIPRDFVISPDGKLLLVANQNSDNIITFRINRQTGQLEETGLVYEIPTPVCLKFGG